MELLHCTALVECRTYQLRPGKGVGHFSKGLPTSL